MCDTPQSRIRSILAAAVLALLIPGALPTPAGAASFSDITFWVGRGTNEAALVIDWQDPALPESRMWGYRWNGPATIRDMMNAVVESDPRLRVIPHPWFPTAVVFGIGYDVDGNRMTVEAGSPGFAGETGFAYDDADWYREGWYSGYWSVWDGVSNPYAGGNWHASTTGYAGTHLADGAWYGLSFDEDLSTEFDAEPRSPVAAESPYAVEVVSYTAGAGVGPDPITGDPYSDPTTAIGRPTVDTTGDGLFIPLNERVPVVAAAPAFRAHEIVTVGIGGELTLRFDHEVIDHPQNPFGVDLLVFGNAFSPLAGGGRWTNGSPFGALLSSTLMEEPALVSVSQDGTNWHSFASGPRADALAPTLGRLIAFPGGAVPPVGAGNVAWWHRATDPTLPPDPAITPAAWNGASVAAVSQWYNGSAGGTGFDLDELPLPPHPGHGLKWIQYVRIQPDGVVTPEIDAVADVAPWLPYPAWQADHFTFVQRANPTISGGDADPDNDRHANLYEYLRGWDPWVAESARPVSIVNGSAVDSPTWSIFTRFRRAARDTRIHITGTTDLVHWITLDGFPAVGNESALDGFTECNQAIPLDVDFMFFRVEATRPTW